MSDVTPPELVPSDAPPRDRRFVWTAAASLLLHAGVVVWLLWPAMRETAEAAPPPAISVDLVPEEVLSGEPPVSSEQPSSEMSSSTEPPSSEEASVSSEAPSAEPSSVASTSASSETPSIEPAPSAPSAPSEAVSEAASSAPASDISSAAPSSAEPSSAAASEPPSTQPASEPPPSASSEQAPTPATRPIVIPVGPSADASEPASDLEHASASSADASSAPPDGEVSALTANGGDAEDGVPAPASSEEPAAAPLPELGKLHSSKRFYTDAILSAPAMAKARDAIEKLPREKRLAQTCNIEAVGQIGNAGRNFSPDAVIADAFAKPAIDGTRFTVGGGAFRSQKKWYAIGYTCTLSEDLSKVTSFSFRLGGDVTTTLTQRVGTK
jgi:hypothetical protein